MKGSLRVGVALAAIVTGYTAQADTGGGATIHNAATLNFSGGTVTSSVDVTVDTIATQPVFQVDNNNKDVNAGDSVTFNYDIINASNGSDTYSLTAGSSDTDVSAPASGPNVSRSSVTLGASIATKNSDSSGTVFIPAGSGSDFQTGDEVVITISGSDYVYQIDNITPGTPANTTGNTTTAETPTELSLSVVTGGAPVIGQNDVPAGTQIGERQGFSVSLNAGTPDNAGTDGTHQIDITGNTSAQDTSGNVVSFDDSVDATATVLSSDVDLVKDVRNIDQSTGFQTSGVTAQTGQTLEYRLTAETSTAGNATGANLEDQLPKYTTYVTSSTTLNGNAVSDAGSTDFPLDEGGIAVNSPGGASGEILDGETAVIKFRVTVD
jgi:uncharacterized repeat protein (TIGR01451 family)